MTLQEQINDASAKAAGKVALKSLRTQQRGLVELDGILQRTHRLEAILTHDIPPHLILPITSEGATALEHNVLGYVSEALAAYDPKSIAVKGYAAYILSVGEQPVPARIPMHLAGLNIEMAITAANITFPSGKERDQKRTPSRSREPLSWLPQEEWHQPTLAPGSEFDIPLSTPSARKYKIIPTRKPVREHFPGYKVPFTISYDGKQITTCIVGTHSKESPGGSLNGHYMSTGIKELYEDHPELWTQRKNVRFKVIEPGKSYVLLRLNTGSQ